MPVTSQRSSAAQMMLTTTEAILVASTIGWLRIQRLRTVYSTVKATIGYWLGTACLRYWSSRSAIPCASYTAMTCPITIRYLRVPDEVGADDADVDVVAGGAEG